MEAINCVDGYKVDHRRQYPNGTMDVYSNFTPRKSRVPGVDYIVFFGLQYMIKRFLIGEFNKFFSTSKEIAVVRYARRINNYLPPGHGLTYEHIGALHDLGYLPVKIKALPEGSKVPIRVAPMTIRATIPEFYWLTNYLETLISCELWMPCTSATTASVYRKIAEEWANKTSDVPEFVDFQCHDFSMRGMPGVDAACASGAGHLLSFTGTDTLPAIDWLEEYYNADCEKEFIGGGVAATEHSVMCMGGNEDEFETFKRLITEVYPTGIVSIVSDTWDLWKVLTDYLPRLKDIILARDGKVVIRPDSGDPVDIICGENSREEYKDITKWLEGQSVHEPSQLWDFLLDDVKEELIHGECGPREFSAIYKVKGQLLKATVHNLSYNRYDKQYYYLEMDSKPEITVEYLSTKPSTKGVIELLYETFGGKKNSKGYIELDPHIGAIYGDSITLDRATQIFTRLAAKGFASTNVVLGIGSYTYQYVTRDTYGWAMKATYGEVLTTATVDMFNQGGPALGQQYIQSREIFKDPVTDDGTKKSARGLLRVDEQVQVITSSGKNKYIHLGYAMKDQCTREEEAGGALEVIFEDGKLVKEWSLAQIRQRLRSQ